METHAEKISQLIISFGSNLLLACLIFILGQWVTTRLSRVLETAMIRHKVDETLASFVKNLVYYALMTFVFLAVLGRLGIQTTSFVAVLGAAGLAVGMALQGSLSNFASGVMIILFRPFKVGDFIAAGNVKGTVKEIQIFSTILSSPDNVRIIAPNAQLTNGSIENYSANETRMIDFRVGIGYSDDLPKAKQVLEEILNSDPRVLKFPAAAVVVAELGESSVNLAARPWIQSKDYWDVYFSMAEKIKLTFDAKGISIPFPQREVHLVQPSGRKEL